MKLDDHPTVRLLAESRTAGAVDDTKTLPAIDSAWLRQLALDSGADDVGLVEIGRPALEPQRAEILRNYPWTRTLIGYVLRMSREPLRGAPRSVANLEFHRVGEAVNEIGAKIVSRLEARGVRAVNPSMGFPMEMYQAPGAVWVVSHKPVAVEAGLGHMGIHRNLIHPKFGNFVLLGTVLVDIDVEEHGSPIEYNPCLECKLCVAACPVGAIGPDGTFNFSSCFTHNYREFLGGFSDWVEQIADARDAVDYRQRISEPETASMWQSLTYGANYKSAYCMAVCPAGEDVIGPFLADKKRHLKEVVKPLQERPEPVYVVEGSDAEVVARSKFKNKFVKPVASGLRPRTIDGMLSFMPIVFQPNRSRGLDATYQFKFTGAETRNATVTIKNGTIDVKDGLVGTPNIVVTADSKTWLGFLAVEKNLPLALIRRKVKIKGDPRLLLAFGRCFPSTGARHRQVDVLPQPSLLKREPSRFLKNDPATGRIRWQGALRLLQKEDVTHNVKTFRFGTLDGSDIPFTHLPGQFLTLTIPGSGTQAKRSYTIASSPTRRDCVEITVKREEHGLGSRWLHDELLPSRDVEIEAPNGSFVFTGREAESVVLIGAGVGITPMMSAVRYLTDTNWPGTVRLILGFHAARDYIFRDELAAIARRNPNLRITVTLSDASGGAWDGAKGHIDAALLASAVPGIASQIAHICGPPAMMDAVKAALRQLGMPEAHIRTEAFGTVKRDPTVKVKANRRKAGRVTFEASSAAAAISAGETVLDAADAAGVFIDSACRSGTCGSCRVKLVSGSVRMAVEDALTSDDKADGYILACQSQLDGDVTVDA